MKKSDKTLSPTPTRDKIKSAIESYCAYQDRCQSEVKEKLYLLGADEALQDELISELLELGFLNEERFARSFCRGKFRIKGWGKNKIKQALKYKKVSEPCIRIGLSEINGDDYFKTLLTQIKKFSPSSYPDEKAQQIIIRKLLSKGFEYDIIRDALKQLKDEEDY